MTTPSRIRAGPPARHRVLFATVLVCIVTISGCGRPAGVLFEPSPNDPVWPSPPDTPRIRYVGQILTDRDLKPARAGGQRLGDLLFGEEPSHAMVSPLGVCTASASRVFVADSNGQVLHVFDLDSRRYQQWRPGKDQQKFAMPVAAAWDGAGHVLVSDSVAGLIFVFDSTGTCTGTIGAGKLKRPCGLVVDPGTGRIFVADSAAHQIVVLSLAGEEIARVGQRGTEPGNFNFPTHVALDRAGWLYVSDTLNFRIQVFTPDLKPIRQIGQKGDMPGYFSQPKGLALDAEDHLYVLDANFESVQVFDSGGRLLMDFGREGHGAGEFWLPSGLCIDPTGRIWVADSYNKRVQVFQYLAEDHTP